MASPSHSLAAPASRSDIGSTPAALAALAGAVAAAVSLAAGELVAAILPGVPSLVAAVGAAVIDLQPPGAKDIVVGLFGTNDKLALEVTVVAVALAIGAGLGVAALARPQVASIGFGAAALVGFGAAASDPQATAILAGLSVVLAAFVGLRVLDWLLDRGVRTPASDVARRPTVERWSRRDFLVRTGVLGAAALGVGLVARSLVARAATVTASIPYPRPSRVAALPPGADLGVRDLTPIVVPNEDFYRIDTALIVPRVDASTWRLRIHGLVERETELSFEELLALGTFEQYVTIACVSNEVGGNLVGNAKWTGVHLHDVLGLAGVRPEASQLVGRSVDGWTAGMPTAWVMDRARDPMIAVLMNDEPLPTAHGFPARLIVPGLYGYVSATKWLSELELTTLDAFDAFWVPRGWAKEAPILTQSRIDVPRGLGAIQAGRVAVAGVAWAPDRGVSRVEVAIDGTWHDAQLSHPISDATWVQWRYAWDATPGHHELMVRATDGTGQVQTEGRTPPAPDGARGWHTVGVDVGD